MAGHSFNKGAVSLLLSIWRGGRPQWLVWVVLLSACSQHTALPPFTASGYADNQGVVRIWRKDSDRETHLRVAFHPWHGDNTTTSEYRWQNDSLTLIALNIYGKSPEQIRVRFDDRGNLSFMQRQANGQKQQLSTDQIERYRYQARRIRQTSDALRQGNITLHQGRWHADRTVTTCEGAKVDTGLEATDIAFIERRQRHSSLDVSIAWLEAPEGAQLLLVANEDFCAWQPTKKAF